jgi:hypothetical protein
MTHTSKPLNLNAPVAYEVVYGLGGHCGPFWSWTDAYDYGVRYLKGSQSETAVYILDRKDWPLPLGFTIASVTRTRLFRDKKGTITCNPKARKKG